jgi:hypothetical protein
MQTTLTSSARVYLHPVLTHTPDSIQRIQRETGMLVVLAANRRPHLVAHAAGRGRGGNAA